MKYKAIELIKGCVPAFLFFLLAIVALATSIHRPANNWDMIMYIAAAKSFEETDTASLHNFTYEQLRQSVPASTYDELVRGPYRHAISTDPSAFEEQLPFYQIRPLYTGLVYALYKTGINIATATHLASALSVMAAIMLLYCISASALPRELVYVVPPLVIAFGSLDLASLSTPDGLAFLAVILSAFLYLKRRTSLLLLLLPAMIGVRTDLILFTLPLLVAVAMSESQFRWKATLSIIASVAFYIWIGQRWNNLGWPTIFYFTLIQTLTHPVSAPQTLTTALYFSALFSGLKQIAFNHTFILYAIVSAYWLYLLKPNGNLSSVARAFKTRPAILATVSMAFITGHFMAFPVIWDRFFSAQYLITSLSLLILISKSWPVPWRRHTH